MADSPALNEKSRAVLITLPPDQLPPPVVDVPGPPPPVARSQSPVPPVPPLPNRPRQQTAPSDSTATSSNGAVSASLLGNNDSDHGGSDDEVDETEGDAIAHLGPGAQVKDAADPYANLDSAFGSYLNNESKSNARRGVDDEDLLF